MSLPVLGNSAGSDSGSTAVASLTYAHTVPSALSNQIILVAVFRDATTGTLTVTYAGQSLTQLGSEVLDPSNDGLSFWSRIAPVTGNNNVVVSTTTNHRLAAASVDYSNTAQSSIFGTVATNSAKTSTSSTNVTTTSTNQLVLDIMTNANATAPTPTSSQTIRTSDSDAGFAQWIGIADKTATGITMTETWSGLDTATGWATIVVAMNGVVTDALAANPASLSVGGSSNTTVQITNNGSATDNITTSIVGASGWLSVSPTTFNGLGAGNSTNFKISVNQAFLVPGTYNDTVRFTSNNGAIVNVPVTLTIPAIVGSIAWSGGSGAQTVNQGLGIIIGTG